MTKYEAIKHFEYIMKIMDDHSDDYQAAKVALIFLKSIHVINESKWEHCEVCNRHTCVTCRRFPFATDICQKCENQQLWSPVNFCYSCGRPLTEEASYKLALRINTDLVAQAKAAEAERDAAIAEWRGFCVKCKWNGKQYLSDGQMDARCKTCRNNKCNWEWYGGKEN